MNQLIAFQGLITASTWVLTYAVHSFVAHGAALLSGRYLVRSPRYRSALYRAAFLLPVLTATALTAGVRPFTPIAEINVAELARQKPGTGPTEVLVTQRVRLTGSGKRSIDSFATDSTALRIAFGATGLAALAALFGLVGQARRYLAFRDRLGARKKVVTADVQRDGAYQLTASSTLGAPVALGLREICVPDQTFESLTAEERRSVIAHEAAHLARRDPLWFAISDAIVALFPWQPLARLLSREARRTAEFCCDDAVVESVGHGRALVRSLATFAAGFDPAETAFAASCGGSPLEERARRLLGPAGGDIRRLGRWAVALALLLLVAVVSVAPAVSTRSKPEQLRHPDMMRRMVIEEVDTTR